MPESTFERFIRDGVRRMTRQERLKLFLAGAGYDDSPDVDVLVEALNMPEPDNVIHLPPPGDFPTVYCTVCGTGRVLHPHAADEPCKCGSTRWTDCGDCPK